MSKLPPLSRLKLIGCVCASSHFLTVFWYRVSITALPSTFFPLVLMSVGIFFVSLGEVLGQVVQGSSRTSSECHNQFLAVRSNHLVCLGGWMLSQGLASTPFCHSPTVHLCRSACCGRRSTPGVPQDGCTLYSDTGSPTGICCLPDSMLAGLGGQDTPCFYLPSIEITPMHAPHSLTSSVSIRAQTQILCLWKYFTQWVIFPVSYNPFWLEKKCTQSSARHLPMCGYITFPLLTLGMKPVEARSGWHRYELTSGMHCHFLPHAGSRSSVNSPEPDGHQISQVSSGKINLVNLVVLYFCPILKLCVDITWNFLCRTQSLGHWISIVPQSVYLTCLVMD